MLHAIIDIGSNTVRMAIYRIEGGAAEMLMKKKHLVGLAAYVKDGIMQPEGIDRAAAALEDFKAFLAPFPIASVSSFTTAALRNAKNSRAAVAALERRTGLSIRVISGEEEAEYDFVGAVHGLAEDRGILLDIGGASTEIIRYEARAIRQKLSLPMGSLSLRTAFVKGFLPTPGEVAAMQEEARRILGEAPLADAKDAALVGIGGTFKGAAALYDALCGGAEGAARGGHPMRLSRLEALLARLATDAPLAEEEAAALLRAVPERMHTVLCGLAIACTAARRFGATKITYSDSGVREGYLYAEILGKRGV